MSKTLFVLSFFFAFYILGYAVDFRTHECAGFPNGCTCTTQNVTVGTTTAEEITYDIVVVAVRCNSVGLTEVPDFSNYTSLSTM